jgi:hypothetical protein
LTSACAIFNKNIKLKNIINNIKMILNNWLLSDISLIVLNYIGKYKKDADLNYLIRKDLCVAVVDTLNANVFDNYDFKKCDTRTANLCVQYNQIFLLELLESKGIKCNVNGINAAAKNGDLDTIKYLEKKSLRCNIIDFTQAIYNRKIEVVKYLELQGFNYPQNSVDIAHKNDHRELVKYMQSKGATGSIFNYKLLNDKFMADMVEIAKKLTGMNDNDKF